MKSLWSRDHDARAQACIGLGVATPLHEPYKERLYGVCTLALFDDHAHSNGQEGPFFFPAYIKRRQA